MTRQFNINTLTSHRIIRFLSTGVLNTFFGYTVYALLLFVHVPYLTALFVSTVVGVIFNYFSFGRFVFNGHSGRYVLVKFIVTYVIVYIANAALLDILTRQFLVSPYVGQVICLPVSIFLSWLLMNKWVYQKD